MEKDEIIPAVRNFKQFATYTSTLETIDTGIFKVDDYGRINGKPLTDYKGKEIGVAIFELPGDDK